MEIHHSGAWDDGDFDAFRTWAERRDADEVTEIHGDVTGLQARFGATTVTLQHGKHGEPEFELYGRALHGLPSLHVSGTHPPDLGAAHADERIEVRWRAPDIHLGDDVVGVGIHPELAEIRDGELWIDGDSKAVKQAHIARETDRSWIEA